MIVFIWWLVWMFIGKICCCCCFCCVKNILVCFNILWCCFILKVVVIGFWCGKDWGGIGGLFDMICCFVGIICGGVVCLWGLCGVCIWGILCINDVIGCWIGVGNCCVFVVLGCVLLIFIVLRFGVWISCFGIVVVMIVGFGKMVVVVFGNWFIFCCCCCFWVLIGRVCWIFIGCCCWNGVNCWGCIFWGCCCIWNWFNVVCLGKVLIVLGKGIFGLIGDMDIGLFEIRDVDIGGFWDDFLSFGVLGWMVIKFGFWVNVDDDIGLIVVLLEGIELGVDFFGGLKGLVLICFINLDCCVNFVICLEVFFICIFCEMLYVVCFCWKGYVFWNGWCVDWVVGKLFCCGIFFFMILDWVFKICFWVDCGCWDGLKSGGFFFNVLVLNCMYIVCVFWGFIVCGKIDLFVVFGCWFWIFINDVVWVFGVDVIKDWVVVEGNRVMDMKGWVFWKFFVE